MIEELNKLYEELLTSYSGGLSNTSTVKFEGIKELFSSKLGISVDDIYATGAGTRPGNLEVRLSQGVQATKHTVLGLGFIVDDKNTAENREKLTKSAFVTIQKFLGRGKSKYDNILILIQSENYLYVTGIVSSAKGEVNNELIKEFNIANVLYISDGFEKIRYQLPQFNRIYFGAPGTGKSYAISEYLILNSIDSYHFSRITFHPEYDYTSFVGGYKPITDEADDFNVKYQFVPEVFIDIYMKAWISPLEPFVLIIEEINRGNCAEIFGDIFQLLDRSSDYNIEPSTELRRFLSKQEIAFKEKDNNDVLFLFEGKLQMPENLSILATMNTSDQSLFPMDSAFKRRWEWEYIPICYEAQNEDGKNNESFNFEISLGDGSKYRWIDFLAKINNDHIKNNSALGMDKCIGNYFTKPDEDNKITLKPFINKVIFYLWNDVFKDEDNKVFESNGSYEDFFPILTNGLAKVKELFERINLLPIPAYPIREEEADLAQVAEDNQPLAG